MMIQAPSSTLTSTSLSKDNLLGELKRLLGQLLEMAPESIDVDAQLVEIGADSLALLNAVETIKDRYGVHVPVPRVFQDLGSLRAIAEFVVQNAPQAVAHAPNPTPTAPAPLSAGSHEPAPSTPSATPFVQTVSVPSITAAANVDLPSIVDQQLKLMAMQLEMLRGAGIRSEISTASVLAPVRVDTPAPTATAAPSSETPIGVLANWRSTANVAKEDIDDKRKAFLLDFIQRFTEKTKGSKARAQKFRTVLADNRVSAGFRPSTKEMIYPIVNERAKGSHIWDVDGNEYIDFSMGFGVNLFGHSPDFIQVEIEKQLAKGMCVGPQSDLCGEVAGLVAKLTGLERVAFVNSGTEAIMTAIRLARAATHRDKVVLFEGSYHGHFDGVLCRPQGGGKSIPVAPGVPKSIADDVIVLPYDTDEALAYVRAHAHELAAVMVESVQSRRPEKQPLAFLKEIREITASAGCAFIFDEVITGFRIDPGGAQAHFGIEADLAAYGKVLGGGLPIGAVAGKSKFLDPIDGGAWQFGDDSFPQSEMTFFAGTFSKHPLAMAASLATLRELEANGKAITKSLNERTEAMANRLDRFFQSEGLPIETVYFGSLFRFKAPLNLDLFFYQLNYRGMYVWEGRNMFLSTAHTDDDVERFIRAVEESVHELQAAGYLPSRPGPGGGGEKKSVAISPSQERFAALSATPSGEVASHICVAVELTGSIDVKRFRDAVAQVFGRHESLRLRFDLANKFQWLAGDEVPRLELLDLSGIASAQASLEKWLAENASQPFDLENDSAVRVHLTKISAEKSLLSLVAHHVAVDGWSIAILLSEIGAVYTGLVTGKPVELPAAPRFRDYLTNFDSWLASPEAQLAKQYWLSRFTSSVPLVRWSKENSARSDFSGERQSRDLEKASYGAIREWSKKKKSTTLMTLLAAFALALEQRQALGGVTVGVPTAARAFPGADALVGNCVNFMPVRISTSPASELSEVVDSVRTAMIEGLPHADFPYGEIVEAIGRPLFNVSFNKEPVLQFPRFERMSARLLPYPISASELDLTMNVTEIAEGLHVEIDYRLAALSSSEATAFIESYFEILKKIV